MPQINGGSDQLVLSNSPECANSLRVEFELPMLEARVRVTVCANASSFAFCFLLFEYRELVGVEEGWWDDIGGGEVGGS